MDGKEVSGRLARAWTVADWYEFLGLVRPVELAIRESPDEEKAISPVLIDLAFERGNAEGQLAGEGR